MRLGHVMNSGLENLNGREFAERDLKGFLALFDHSAILYEMRSMFRTAATGYLPPQFWQATGQNTQIVFFGCRADGLAFRDTQSTV